MAFEQRATESFAETVRRGLRSRPAHLPSRLLYDARGSELFERITETPEYYPTRTEAAILAAHASDIVGDASEIVELGSGSSAKTNLLLDVLRGVPEASYLPVDISADFLQGAANELRLRYPEITIAPIAREYFAALKELPPPTATRLFVFLGSNIGNFEPGTEVEFLRAIGEAMGPDDSLLIGLDLVKDERTLLAAYDDSAGVTASFTLNLLERMRREAGAELEPADWRHDARWIPHHERMEMGLVALRATAIRMGEDEFAFVTGERIRTEFSHKYTRASAERLASSAGMEVVGWWTDSAALFADSCWRRR